MSYTVEKIKEGIAFAYAKKYGVYVDDNLSDTAMGVETLCRRAYDCGWDDGRKRLLERIWIPCNESLPEDSRNVLVTYKCRAYIEMEPILVTIGNYVNGHWSCCNEAYVSNDDVLAWMPLPEQYRGENERVRV